MIKRGHYQLNQTNVYYEHYLHPTSKKTIVLLHGFLSSTFSFRRLIPFLSKSFNVLSIDLPPFGRSGKNVTFAYSYQNLASSVIHLISNLGLGKIIVLGHSMGGQIALNISKQKAELVEHIILLCSSGYLQRSKLPLVISSYIPFFHLYVKYHLARSGVIKNLQNVVYNHQMIDDGMIKGYLQPFIENNEIFRALTKMIRDREGDLSSEVLQTIETPSLLIWGEHDKVVPLRVGERLQKDLKKSDLIVLKETGHLVPEERPEEVYNHILKFVGGNQ